MTVLGSEFGGSAQAESPECTPASSMCLATRPTAWQQSTQAGVRKVRTMIEHDNQLVMAFFRSQGLMVGRFIGMEKNLD